MTAQYIENFHSEITQLIDQKQLKCAISRLNEWFVNHPDWESEEKLKQWETTYKYMLLYFSNGNPDPDREKVSQNLISHLYIMVDSIADNLLIKESPSYFFDRKRFLNYAAKTTVSQLERRIKKNRSDLSLTNWMEVETQKDQKISALSHELDNDLSELFLQTWVYDRWTESDKVKFREILTSDFPENGLCLMVSAITLSLLRRFDEGKCLWLIEACYRTEESIRQRAMVGILLVFYIHQNRLVSFPEIAHSFEILTEQQGVVSHCRNIVLHFIRSRETEKISRRLTDEILPEMMKISPLLRKKMNLEDWQHESGDDEKNPDWQAVFEQSGLNDKLKELSELQQDGSDVFMTTFSGLKSFPFFYNVSNWFLPFSLHHSAFLDLFPHQQNDSSMLGLVMKSGVLCNSDKYSLCFSLRQMPDEQRRMLVDQFTGEGADIAQAEEELLKNNKKGETIAKQYIQDLYRFFKLHPHRSDFFDVFALPMHFHRLEFLRPLLSDSESLRVIAEFFFRKEFYADALDVFTQLSINEAGNSDLFQKIGYCHQLLANDAAALKAYLKADVIFPDSAWTIRRIAQCYRRLKLPEQALEHYSRYDKLMPNNLSVILNIGHCYLEQKDYASALRYYFKADYLDPNNPKAWRPIAWCSFLVGKYEQAERYYLKVIVGNPTPQDLMNIGHVVWCQHNTSRALDYYLSSIHLNEGGWERFKENFLEDSVELQKNGLSDEELSMMLDQLQYRLEE